jgi:hypothetical protein
MAAIRIAAVVPTLLIVSLHVSWYDLSLTLFQWRQWGRGEAYIYADENAQSSDFCSDEKTCLQNGKYGYSIERGSFKFQRGTWSRIKQVIKLNDADYNGNYEENGIFQLYVNGELQIDVKGIVFRRDYSGGAIGIDFTTFFGGNANRYQATKDEFTYFKNVRLSSYCVDADHDA